jgi:hypothetical protein
MSGGGIHNSDSSLVLTNVTISENEAGTSGGGMYNNISSPVLTNVTISGNTAEGSGPTDGGGGIFNGNSSPVLTNVDITGNYATGSSGGGIFNINSNPVLINVTVSGNSAMGDGGGIYNMATVSMMLINMTIAGNRAGGEGGGIYNEIGEPTIINSIIWGNTAFTGDGIYNFSPSAPPIGNSIVQDAFSGAYWTGTAGISMGSNLGSDPLFTDPKPAASAPTTTGDYSLQSGSPARNVGSNAVYPAITDPLFAGVTDTTARAAITTALAKDLAGNLRFNGTIDMGAYEY